MTIFHIAWTILLVVAFVMIAIWAFSSERKNDFDEAAWLALEDDSVDDEKSRSTEVKDG